MLQDIDAFNEQNSQTSNKLSVKSPQSIPYKVSDRRRNTLPVLPQQNPVTRSPASPYDSDYSITVPLPYDQTKGLMPHQYQNQAGSEMFSPRRNDLPLSEELAKARESTSHRSTDSRGRSGNLFTTSSSSAKSAPGSAISSAISLNLPAQNTSTPAAAIEENSSGSRQSRGKTSTVSSISVYINSKDNSDSNNKSININLPTPIPAPLSQQNLRRHQNQTQQSNLYKRSEGTINIGPGSGPPYQPLAGNLRGLGNSSRRTTSSVSHASHSDLHSDRESLPSGSRKIMEDDEGELADFDNDVYPAGFSADTTNLLHEDQQHPQIQQHQHVMSFSSPQQRNVNYSNSKKYSSPTATGTPRPEHQTFSHHIRTPTSQPPPAPGASRTMDDLEGYSSLGETSSEFSVQSYPEAASKSSALDAQKLARLVNQPIYFRVSEGKIYEV